MALIQAQHVGWIPSQNKIGEGIVNYSLEKSHRKSWQNFKSFLGKCLDGKWAMGYESNTLEETRKKEIIFLESRRLMPTCLLEQDAGLGCLASAKVLQERGLKSSAA